MDFSNIMNKVIAHKSKIENVEKDYHDNLLKIERYKKELDIANELYKRTELGYSYLEKIINIESEKFIKKIRDLITYGLSVIFFDRDYKCDIKVEGNNASIRLIYTDEDGNIVNTDIRDGVGDGVRTVIGTILLIFFLYHYKVEPIYFVDEGFYAISEKYLPYFVAFLKQVCKENGLKIMLITHDQRIMPYADKVYKISNGKSHLIKKNNDKGGVQ